MRQQVIGNVHKVIIALRIILYLQVLNKSIFYLPI